MGKNETLMKSFVIKTLMMVSLGEGEKTVGVKVFLAGGCREVVLVIKVEVLGSVDSFGDEAQERCLAFSVQV